MNYDLILKNVARYISLTAEEAAYFTSLLQPKKFKRKEHLLTAGQICKHENFVVKGCLKIYHIDENGYEHIVYFAIEDWWITDLYSTVLQKPALFNTIALEDTEVLQIPWGHIDELLLKVPKFERFFRLVYQRAIITHQLRMLYTLELSAEKRYAIFREKYPQLDRRVPQKQIAAFLGITPEFLSRIRKKVLRT